MVWMINIVMKIAPLGVFGLMADAVGTFGFDALMVVFKLFVVYVTAIAIFGFIFYPLLVKALSKTSALAFLSAYEKASDCRSFNGIINGNTACKYGSL